MPKTENVTAQLPKFDKKLFEKLSAIIAKEAGETAKTQVQKNIKSVKAIASGQLYDSVTAEVIKSKSRSFLVSVGSDDRAAEPIESGIKPTFVPIIKIYEWMRDKGIGNDPAFANYVRNKLAERGYKGRKVFEKAEETLIEQLDSLIEDILNREDFT
ncbi:MAG TPA: hypothetical protein PLP33_27875 [Leptospiraceae bacterium]|nr:hypothetical protein [Leptospiraceae bacterium]